LEHDLLHPSEESEARKHKLKRLVQSPNSFFMDVKCPGCVQITTVFSHVRTRDTSRWWLLLFCIRIRIRVGVTPKLSEQAEFASDQRLRILGV